MINEPLNRLRHHVTGSIERGETLAVIEERPTVGPDVELSNGRVIRTYSMANGASDAVPTSGPYAMTESEWAEYQMIIRDRVRSERAEFGCN